MSRLYREWLAQALSCLPLPSLASLLRAVTTCVCMCTPEQELDDFPPQGKLHLLSVLSWLSLSRSLAPYICQYPSCYRTHDVHQQILFDNILTCVSPGRAAAALPIGPPGGLALRTSQLQSFAAIPLCFPGSVLKFCWPVRGCDQSLA